MDAVIDKDLASAKLAKEVGVDLFCIATDVAGVYKNYGTSQQRFLGRLTTDEAEDLLRDGQFPPGSMGPKVEAAVQFVRATGRRAVITSVSAIEAALKGEAGTHFVP